MPNLAFAITVAHNEDFFLNKRVDYYGDQLGLENLFIVDHGSTDQSFRNLPESVNVVRVPRTVHSDDKRAHFVSNFHAALLQYYSAGFVTDADEFIIADPHHYSSLQDFALKAEERHFSAIGYNVWHMPDIEGPFDYSSSILSQRKHCVIEISMCKPVFSAAPTRWGGEFHAASNPIIFNPHLFMLHLKNFDKEWRLRRQAISRNWEWGGNYGMHSRGPDEDVHQRFDRLTALRRKGLTPFFSEDNFKTLTSYIIQAGSKYSLKAREPRLNGHVRHIPDRFMSYF